MLSFTAMHMKSDRAGLAVWATCVRAGGPLVFWAGQNDFYTDIWPYYRGCEMVGVWAALNTRR